MTQPDLSIFESSTVTDENQPDLTIFENTQNPVIAEAVKVNPAEQAKLNRLSRESQLPADMIEGDLQGIEQDLRSQSIDLSKSPKTADWMSKYENAAVAHTDVDTLKNVELTMADIPLGIDYKVTPEVEPETAKDLLRAWGRGSGNLVSSLGQLLSVIESGGNQLAARAENIVRAGVGAEPVAPADTAVSDWLREIGNQTTTAPFYEPSQYSRDRAADVQAAEGFFGTIKALGENPSQIFEGVVQSAPSFVGPAAITKIAGIKTVAATSGTIEGGAAGADARQQVLDMSFDDMVEDSPRYVDMVAQGVDPQKAKEILAEEAGLTATAITVPIATLLTKATGAAEIEGQFFTDQKVFDTFAKWLKGTGVETVEETGQSATSQVATNVGVGVTGDQTRNPMQGVEESAAQGAVLGAAQSGGIKSVEVVRDIFHDAMITSRAIKQRESVFVAQQKTIDKLAELSDQAELKKLDAESFKQFVNHIDGDRDTRVHLDAVQTQLYLNSLGDKTDPAITMLREALGEAATLGYDVTIPVGDFAVTIAGSPHFEALREFMSLSENSPSPFRKESDDAAAREYLRSLIDTADENVTLHQQKQQYADQVREQLVDTGRMNAKDAAMSAAVVPEWAASFAKRNGMTLEQVKQQLDLKIEGPLSGELSRLTDEQFILDSGFVPDQDTKAFYDAFQEAKAAHSKGPSVYTYSPDEYAGMRLFTTDDRQVGFAVKPDGDIVSVFKKPGSKVKGAIQKIIPAAVAAGGTKLDAFDGYLVNEYKKAGFVEVGRAPWNDEYKPDGWDYDTMGRPDVVYMEYRGDRLTQNEKRFLTGAPRTANIPGRGLTELGVFEPAVQAARDYMASIGQPYVELTDYVVVDEARAKRIAAEFDKMPHTPNDPEVKAAYEAMINETIAQYEAILKTGLKVEFITGEDPYTGGPYDAVMDVVENNHMWVWPTRRGFGTDQNFDPVDNPLLAETKFTISGETALANDIFRVVHDYFGHVKNGVGFRANGEENAWQAHASMYTPLARRAMTTETRGQNSWLNYGPHGEKNRTAKTEDTIFADQKIGLLPEWVSEEGRLSASRFNQFAGVNSRTAIMDDLERAKQMREKGLGNDATARQTGWFLGVDGRWRYEISDDQAKWRVEPYPITWDDVAKRLYGVKFEKLDRDSDERRRVLQMVDNQRRIDNYLDHDQLFNAYPQLRNIKLVVSDFLPPNAAAAYFEKQNEIHVNYWAPKEDMLSAVLHELQHAIQKIEDFARGGSTDEGFTANVKNAIADLAKGKTEEVERWEWRNQWKIKAAEKAAEISRNGVMYRSAMRLMDYAKRDKPSSVFRHIRNEAQWIYAEQFYGNREANDLQRMFVDLPRSGAKRNEFIRKMSQTIGEFLIKQIPEDQLYKFKNDERTTDSMLKALSREASLLRRGLKPFQELKAEAKRAVELDQATLIKNPYEIYRALAGEIEARTTQNRMKLTPEQRRTRPVSLDQDLPSSEAIVVVGGMELKVPEAMMSQEQPYDPEIFNQKSRGYYEPKNSLIRLNESSNLSTFLHEFAHAMYEMELVNNGSLIGDIHNWFKRNAKDVAAEAQTIINQQTPDFTKSPIIVTNDDVVAYLDNKTTGDTDKDSALRIATHEQFARGYEAYLMEGKSPSEELRDVFRTFTRWLVAIYKNIRGLNVKLDDDARRFFDRLTATDVQIRAAQVRANYSAMFNDASMAEMSDKEFEKYQQQKQRVKDKADETLRDKMVAQLRRRTEKWWKEEKQDVVDQVKVELSNQPVYRAINGMRSGTVKMDHQAVLDLFGEDVTNAVGIESRRIPTALRNMTVKGAQGVRPDDAAAFFGFASASEMVDQIKSTPSLNKAADEKAEQIMVDRHGDILNDGTIEKEADEAVQNEERAELLLMELKALAKGSRIPVIDRQVLKATAEDAIAKLSYREIHPAKYRRAEIRAAQESAVALKNGNREEATRAKARQLMNHYLANAATDARNETMRIVDSMSRYSKKKVREEIMKAEGGYWEQIVNILSRFEFRKSATLDQVDQVNQGINLWAKERIEVDGDGLVLSPVVLNELYQTHWKNVKFSDLKGIADSVKNIEYVARYSNKLTRMGDELEFKQLVTRWVDHLKQQPVRFSSQRTDTIRGKNWGRWAMAQMTKIPYLCSWLDGGERVGLSHQILMQPLNDAYSKELALWKTVGNDVLKALESRSAEDRKRHATKIFIKEIQDEKNDGNLFGSQILAVALNTGNESNLRKMLLGEGWANPDDETTISINNPQLQAVLKHMTKSDWDLVQLLWDKMEELYPQLAEVHRRTTGLTPPKIEATKIKTPFGEYRGGYYPVKYDPGRSFKSELNEEKLNAQTESMFATSGSIQASVNASATNERTKYYAQINLNLNVIPNHFQETIHYITHHDAVREINKLLRNPSVAEAIKGVVGSEEYAQLRPWLNDIAKDGREAPAKMFWDAVLQRLRFGVTLGTMGFKVSTAIMQLSGLSNTVAEVGIKNVYQSLRTILGSPKTMQSAWEFASENSKILKYRTQTMDREIKNALNQLAGKNGILAAVQELSMKHIAYTQTFAADLPSWYAAYIKKMDETGDEQKAFQYADWVVENIQGSGATKDMARIMRGQSEAGKMFTMFMTFFSALWNMERDLVKGVRNKTYSVTTVGAKVAFLFTIPVLFEMLVRGEFGGDDEDDETLLQKTLTKTALFPFQSIPFARDMINGVTGDYGYNISPIASLMEQGMQSIPELIKRPLTDEEITKSQVKGATKFAGALIGIPGTSQAWSTGESLYDVLVEGEDRTMREILVTGPDKQ